MPGLFRNICSTLTLFAAASWVSPALAADAVAVKEAKPAAAAKEAAKAPAAATEKSDKDAAAKETKKVRLAHIRIEGALPESPGQVSLFGDLGSDLRKTLARLEKAADDKNVAGVVLEVDAAVGRGKLNEIRAAIKRVRSSGKKVHCYLESAMGPQYLVASACDEIVLPELGDVMIPGVRGEFAFYKDLLGKLGVEADFVHIGDFKGAAEPYTRDSLSEPVRKNMTALIDDLYDDMLATIAADRGLKVDEVRKLVDQGLLMATDAKASGLIDRIAYADEFRESLKEQYGADKLVYVENYAKAKVDADFSGPMGMMKFFQTVFGGPTSGSGTAGPKLALVYAVGPIMTGEGQAGFSGEQSIGSTSLVKALKEAADDENVKAIVMRVDSPGGSALASDLIWRQMEAIDVPIVVSMGDVAASGGYYISMGADRIFAEPGTITGSIGVVGGKLALKGMFDKVGIATESIARGANSGIFSSTEKFTDGERQLIEKMMHDVYGQFTAKAAAGRKMKLADLEKLAGGQVYTGRVAKRNGLIDEIGTLHDAIAAAKRLAGLDANQKYELKILPKPENPLEQLFGADLDAEKEARLRMLRDVGVLAPELSGALRHAAMLREAMQHPVALMMPYWVEIK